MLFMLAGVLNYGYVADQRVLFATMGLAFAGSTRLDGRVAALGGL